MDKIKKFYNDNRNAVDAGLMVTGLFVVAGMWYHTGKTVGFNHGYIQSNKDNFIVGASKISREDGTTGVAVRLANGASVNLWERKKD